jgi:hypothetical protein
VGVASGHVLDDELGGGTAEGDESTRQRELREAHRLFREMGGPIRAGEVRRPSSSPVTSRSAISVRLGSKG